jgi:hypothetical protein
VVRFGTIKCSFKLADGVDRAPMTGGLGRYPRALRGVVMLRQFTMCGQTEEEIPLGAVVTVDTSQRELTAGEIFAFLDPDGDHFVTRIDSISRAQRTVVDRARCQIVGRVVAWVPVLH